MMFRNFEAVPSSSMGGVPIGSKGKPASSTATSRTLRNEKQKETGKQKKEEGKRTE